MKPILLWIAFFLPSVAFASVFVQPTAGVNTSESSLTLATELVRTNLAADETQEISDSTEKAEFELYPKLLTIGESFLFSLEKRKHGHRVYFAQLHAESLNDLETAITRVTYAVLHERDVTDPEHVNQVTQAEAHARQHKLPTVRNWSVAIGPEGSTGLKAGGILVGFDFGYSWELKRNIALRLFLRGATLPTGHEFEKSTANSQNPGNEYSTSGSTVSEQGSGYTAFGLGGRYLFSDRDTTPLVALDLGFGVALKRAPPVERVGGLLFGVGAGYRLFRTSSVSLEVSLRYAVLSSATSAGLPSTYGISTAVCF